MALFNANARFRTTLNVSDPPSEQAKCVQGGLKPRATKSTSPTTIGSGSCGKTLEEVLECFGS